MSNYEQGRRAEYRTMRRLEDAGYQTARTAGSHSPFDVIGISTTDTVLVQVKRGGKPSASALAAFRELPHAENVRLLVHWWKPDAHDPVLL